jgi:hypothetical protein
MGSGKHWARIEDTTRSVENTQSNEGLRMCQSGSERMRGRKKSHAEIVKETMDREEWYQRRIAKKPLKSPCLKGRLKHYFREPKTRSLTPDLKCKWCGKTVAEVRAEQRRAVLDTC